MNIPDVLATLIPAINEIDGGCDNCIHSFVRKANSGLRNAGYSYRYDFDGWNAYVVDSAAAIVFLKPIYEEDE